MKTERYINIYICDVYLWATCVDSTVKCNSHQVAKLSVENVMYYMIIELSEGRHVFCDNSDTQIWCHDLQLFFIFFFVDHLLVLLFYFWQKRGGQKLLWKKLSTKIINNIYFVSLRILIKLKCPAISIIIDFGVFSRRNTI
jgi:hypothetical protein